MCPGWGRVLFKKKKGVFLKNGELKTLAEQIVGILKNDDFRIQLSQNALIYSKSFDWDQVAEKFMKVNR